MFNNKNIIVIEKKDINVSLLTKSKDNIKLNKKKNYKSYFSQNNNFSTKKFIFYS